ncbi:MAG: anti-sigma factor antagonist [Halanaerobiaceae bacterium]|nr:anti-sigma factor antagonist [Halanaerobiaceae bacterium]
MDISTDLVGNVLIARIRGELDISTVPLFKKRIVSKTEDGNVKNLVLNLKGVTFIDSSGLGAILGRYRSLQKKDGRVLLVGLVPQVKKILTMAGVLTVMNEYKSEESALRDIHEGRIA